MDGTCLPYVANVAMQKLCTILVTNSTEGKEDVEPFSCLCWAVFLFCIVGVKNSSLVERVCFVAYFLKMTCWFAVTAAHWPLERIERRHPVEWLRLTRKITQRWDLMALRLSASPKTTSDPPPWPRPSSRVHCLSLVICQTQLADLITAHFGSADYTLLRSEQASFSNFTWQQITGLLQE